MVWWKADLTTSVIFQEAFAVKQRCKASFRETYRKQIGDIEPESLPSLYK